MLRRKPEKGDRHELAGSSSAAIGSMQQIKSVSAKTITRR
jgi:hypothetical protein